MESAGASTLRILASSQRTEKRTRQRYSEELYAPVAREGCGTGKGPDCAVLSMYSPRFHVLKHDS